MLTKEIVFGPGTTYQRLIVIDRPKGKNARRFMPEVVAFVRDLRETLARRLDERDYESDEVDLDMVMDMINTFWETDKFENEILPFALNLDTPEGRKFLEENGTQGEVMEAFLEAARWLVTNSFGRPEVQEALGKSLPASEAVAGEETILN
jgi:hypothetical protein